METSPEGRVQRAVSKTFGLDETDQRVTYVATREGIGGFLSSVQFLTVTKPDEEKADVVLKTPDSSKFEEVHASIGHTGCALNENDFVTQAHNTEVSFLKVLSAYKSETGQLSWLPDLYAAQSAAEPSGGYIIMEALSHGVPPDDIAQLSDAVLKETLSALADIAVLSLKKPEVLSQVQSFTAVYSTFISDVKFSMNYMREQFPKNFNVNVEQILAKFSLEEYLNFIRCCPVRILVHRDVFPRNLLVAEDDKEKFVSVLDWQVGGIGPPGEDLARLLTTSLNAETRRLKTDYYLRYYYDKIEQKCEEQGVPLKFAYSDVKAGYDGTLPYTTLLFCAVAGLCLSACRDQRPEAELAMLVDRVFECVQDVFGK